MTAVIPVARRLSDPLDVEPNANPSRPAVTRTPADSVFGPFLDDHRHVLSRLETLERAIESGGPLRPSAEHELQSVVALLRHQLASHVAAEERVLYPALIEAFPEAAPGLGPLEAEHADLRSMLERLDALLAKPAAADRDEQVVVQARDLVDLLRIHIRKEEQAVFAVAARVLTAPELARLGERVARHRETHDPESGPPAGKGTRS
jgi:hemerythrin-like domain-containing protein